MRVIVSGGGTGGHIYPALAIADAIINDYPEAQILYVGTKGSLEEDLVSKKGLPFSPIRVKGIPRKVSKKSFQSLKALMQGLKDSKNIIKSFKPDLIVGTGGYVCAPICYKGSRMGVPVVIHEQNAFPGLTNKLLSNIAKDVMITYDESRRYFKHQNKVHLTGNPVRQELYTMNRLKSREELELGQDEKLVLSFGGSGGQKSLNEAIIKYIGEGVAKDIKLIHVTGKANYDRFKEMLNDKSISLTSNVQIIPYIYNMPTALSASDLVITSGGAIALAEIAALGKPGIFIPKAYTTENHQEYNARVFERNGAGVVILEKDLPNTSLKEVVESLVANKEKLNAMEQNSRNLANPSTMNNIMDILNKYIR